MYNIVGFLLICSTVLVRKNSNTKCLPKNYNLNRVQRILLQQQNIKMENVTQHNLKHVC